MIEAGMRISIAKGFSHKVTSGKKSAKANFTSTTIMILFSTILSVPWFSLAVAEELLLRDQTLVQSQALTTLDLFSEEKTMGQEAVIQSKESQVTIGKSYISFIPSKRERLSGATMGLDRYRRDLYLIWLPFTLQELSANKYYHKVRFQIDLANQDTVAFDLLPSNVASKEHVVKTYTLSPQLKFKGVEGSIGGLGTRITFESLHPVITAYGIGESRFYWVYESWEGQQVLPGTKHALIILDVPRGAKSVHGKISCQAVIMLKGFGGMLPKTVKTDYYSIQWNLSTATHLY